VINDGYFADRARGVRPSLHDCSVLLRRLDVQIRHEVQINDTPDPRLEARRRREFALDEAARRLGDEVVEPQFGNQDEHDDDGAGADDHESGRASHSGCPEPPVVGRRS